MNVLAAMLLAAATLRGTVTTDGFPLPGCTVILEASPSKRETVTDVEGRYHFDDLTAGEYRLKFRLSGFDEVERWIRAGDSGESVEDAALRIPEAGTYTTDCRPCFHRAPETVWEFPHCEDYELDETLTESIERNDRSAIELAQRRYRGATTYAQKHRLAAALLRHVPDDSRYWNELYEPARNLVEKGEKLGEWCEAQKLSLDDYRGMANVALAYVAADPRSRPLLMKALESNDLDVVRTAIIGVVDQRDESALAAVAKALARFPEEAGGIVMNFTWFRSAAADELALRYLDDDQRAEYREIQRQIP
jgi:hypothetical protein